MAQGSMPWGSILSRVMDKKNSENSLKSNEIAGIKEVFKNWTKTRTIMKFRKIFYRTGLLSPLRWKNKREYPRARELYGGLSGR